jgi:alpha-tubulin suppressor-like RCC1 family protein
MKNSYKLSNKLKEYFIDNLKLVFVTNNDVIIVTKDDKVYEIKRYGKSSLIAFSENYLRIESLIVNELCYKKVIDLANGDLHYVALTEDGYIYCWGDNSCGQLGNGSKIDNKKPELNENLSDSFIIDVKCGSHHSVVLTNKGEVYSWGFHRSGLTGYLSDGDYQISPIKVDGFDGKKVKAISCGYWHSMALTECGRVYGWGNNKWGQLGVKNCESSEKAEIIEISCDIAKINCGRFHNLLLTSDGQIYVFGRNDCGQLGNEEEENHSNFVELNVEEKIINIASHYEYNISIAKTRSKIYVWGQYDEDVEGIDHQKNCIKIPEETEFESINDLFTHYFDITYKPMAEIFEFKDKFFQNGKYKKCFIQMEKLGEGNYGQVYKVEKGQDHYYAVHKRILKAENEFEILKSLENYYIIENLQNIRIVKYFDAWLENEYFQEKESEIYDKSLIFYIQMELCDKNLNEIIEEIAKDSNLKSTPDLTPLGYYFASHIFIEILEGVNYLHKQKPQIIHRDLKPQNILLKKVGQKAYVKIADFGLMAIHEYAEQTHTKDLGSLRYMAPEIMQSRKYDTKADIYSLGIILQQLLFIDMYR